MVIYATEMPHAIVAVEATSLIFSALTTSESI